MTLASPYCTQADAAWFIGPGLNRERGSDVIADEPIGRRSHGR
jgi:hypothetical protein